MSGSEAVESAEMDENHRLIGAFVNQFAIIEALLTCWLQKLSTDPELVALVLGDREFSVSQQLSKAVRKLGERRAPEVIADLVKVLKQVDGLAPIRNAVAHNPHLLTAASKSAGWIRSRKQGPEKAAVTIEDVKAGVRTTFEVVKGLEALYHRHFGADAIMSFDTWDR